ncbi:hypothetical protein [Kitasatospora sp. MAP12-44]|uniref:hypothetical protein n=1 Tax=unclassified Kitasatospora TaxID=2633591 RepID=UPI002474ED6C|nr:hypothetical protein [Kitasatospora sp. MAP12-44]MDH6107982.1 hypothetical protein [Kitasatospora sp. MAP12-44]
MSQDELTASTHKSLGQALRKIAPTAVLVRIYPEHRADTYFFEPDFHRLVRDRQAEEGAVRLIRSYFGDQADWRVAHDFYLPAGELYLTPEPHQNGYIPEDDESFGLAPARRIAIFDGNF